MASLWLCLKCGHHKKGYAKSVAETCLNHNDSCDNDKSTDFTNWVSCLNGVVSAHLPSNSTSQQQQQPPPPPPPRNVLKPKQLVITQGKLNIRL